jgi:hypothetical protein
MKKLLTLALALVALAVFSNVGLTQQRIGSQGVINSKGPIEPTYRVQSTPPVLKSTAGQLNWPETFGSKQGDLVRSLRGQKLTAQVVGSGANEVIVIYGPDGGCRVCLGSAKSCKEACGRAVSASGTQSQ